YAQPDGDNLVMTVLGASSISEALTRVGDLASAAQQASRTRRALNRDLASLSAQKVQIETDRKRHIDTRQQLEDQFNQLVQLEAQRVQQAQQAVQQAPASAP